MARMTNNRSRAPRTIASAVSRASISLRRGSRSTSRRLAVRPAVTSEVFSGGAASAGTRSFTTRKAATTPSAAHTSSTLAMPPSQIRTPVSEPAIAIPAASAQPSTTFAAVSWFGVTASDGMSVD